MYTHTYTCTLYNTHRNLVPPGHPKEQAKVQGRLRALEPDTSHSRHQGLAGEGVTRLLSGHVVHSWPQTQVFLASWD